MCNVAPADVEHVHNKDCTGKSRRVKDDLWTNDAVHVEEDANQDERWETVSSPFPVCMCVCRHCVSVQICKM